MVPGRFGGVWGLGAPWAGVATICDVLGGGRRLDPFYYSETDIGWIVLLLGTAGVLNRPGTLLFSLLRAERRENIFLCEEMSAFAPSWCAKIAETVEGWQDGTQKLKRVLFVSPESEWMGVQSMKKRAPPLVSLYQKCSTWHLPEKGWPAVLNAQI